MKARISTIVAAKQAGGDLDVIDKGGDLDENNSGVEDASDMDGDVEKCQFESTRNLSKCSKSMRSRSIF